MTNSGVLEEQAIACLSCGLTDRALSDDDRAYQWPVWEPGAYHCPRCGGTAWATRTREVEVAAGQLAAESRYEMFAQAFPRGREYGSWKRSAELLPEDALSLTFEMTA